MKSWKPRKKHFNNIIMRSAKAATETEADDTHPLPAPVLDWLTQLRLLYGVPFEYLIADQRLLPKESLRFFYVDRNWADLLIDGALSIGTNSSADNLHTQKVYRSLQKQIDANEPKLRSQLRGKPVPQTTVQGGTLAGFLLRSVVVSGWPGMEVKAFNPDGTGIDIIRMDHLSPDVLLCIFNGVPDRVDFVEPPEGLHFGVRAHTDPNPTKGDTVSYIVLLRGLGFNGFPAGIQPPGFPSATVEFRQGDNQPAGVLNVGVSAANIKTALANMLSPQGTYTSAEFAIQMVRAAGLQTFQAGVKLAAADESIADNAV